MSFEQAFKRLTLQSKPLCQYCRRTFTSSQPAREQQPATAAFTELVEASRRENSTAQSQRINNRRASPSDTQPTSNPFFPTTNTKQRPDLHELGVNLIRQSQASSRAATTSDQKRAELDRTTARKDLEQQIPRRFRAGEVYAPHDLSGVEMSKWKKLRRKARVPSHGRDVLDQLGLDPRKEYKNFSMMAEYVSDMGRIKHRSETGLRPVNQRRVAKAVRRAIGSGVLMPSVYKHPELLKHAMTSRAGYRY
ncbi:hypothetical protein LTR62_002464 [Meristemomyces frigidus]|uniref:Small ribosomal subunit protein bS18m n=1 Tax=Meristemomyces frigidus TaxID=1508187 RepID=A0AAN7YHQ1_9PEZI|nr:hypothetical protein LTR62_002464 [Meristemomyces frigidus]